jgi:hypothetical protein
MFACDGMERHSQILALLYFRPIGETTVSA